MDVSIIIVNYNTFAFTKAAIESVFEKTEGITFELILVDNNSPDGSGLRLKNFFGEKIVYIQSDENIGFGRANNLGIGQACGRNIFLLNPDTTLVNNAVKILSDYLNANPKVGVCGGNLYDENKISTHSFGRYLPSFFGELDLLVGRNLLSIVIYGKNTSFNYTDKPIKVGFITGADMMIRKAVLDKIGVFDADFFMYYEEAELTYRIKKTGYQIHCVPQSAILHFESKSSSDEISKLKRSLAGRRTYYQKTHGLLGQIVVNTVFMLTVLSRLCGYFIIGNKQKVRFFQSAWRYM